jgi:hypothetical protein
VPDGYYPLIGDVCYRFKSGAKESFFKDLTACKIFILTSKLLKEVTIESKKLNKKDP